MAEGSKPQETPKPVTSAVRGTEGALRDADLARRMEELSRRLDHETEKVRPKAKSDGAGMGQGFRAAADLSGGVIVGVILGLGLDRLAGSSPWGLIIFVMLGFCAGVMNMLRGTGLVTPPGPRSKD